MLDFSRLVNSHTLVLNSTENCLSVLQVLCHSFYYITVKYLTDIASFCDDNSVDLQFEGPC